MNLTWDVYAIGAFAALFAGVSKGGFGSGAAFAGVAILALVVPPGTALGVMLPLLMLVDGATLRPYWRQWDWRPARLLMLGAVPGVILGALLFQIAPAELLRFLIGVIALLFVLWQVGQRTQFVTPVKQVVPDWAGVLAGGVAGFTSFVSHAGGPAVAMYMLWNGVGKTPYQATSVLIFGMINLFKVVPYAALGLFTSQTLWFDLMLAPFALLGAWIGVKAHRMMPERVFFAITYVLLVITGCKLIWDALN